MLPALQKPPAAAGLSGNLQVDTAASLDKRPRLQQAPDLMLTVPDGQPGRCQYDNAIQFMLIISDPSEQVSWVACIHPVPAVTVACNALREHCTPATADLHAVPLCCLPNGGSCGAFALPLNDCRYTAVIELGRTSQSNLLSAVMSKDLWCCRMYD